MRWPGNFSLNSRILNFGMLALLVTISVPSLRSAFAFVLVGYVMGARGEKVIINVSRQILYASREKDLAQAARTIAEKIRDQINDYRHKAR
jgi:hypothetical protein